MPDYSFQCRGSYGHNHLHVRLKGKEVPASYTLPLGERPTDYAPQGAFGKILDKYRCLVCHKINGKGGEVANDLSQEGSRVREEWIEGIHEGARHHPAYARRKNAAVQDPGP